MDFHLAPPIKTLDLIDIEFDDDEEQELLSALCFSALASAPENGVLMPSNIHRLDLVSRMAVSTL